MDIRFNLIKPVKRRKIRRTLNTSLQLFPYKKQLTRTQRTATDNIQYSAMQSKGFTYEKKAIAFLQSQGLELLEHNLSCKVGELDIVMKDKSALVFVEVRFRKNQDFGGAISSISPQKAQRLFRTAAYFLPYLSQKYFQKTPPCRFDAVCFNGEEKIWLKNFLTHYPSR